MWGGTAAQCSALPTSIPAALGCTTCSPSVQSCDFSFARFFCFDRDLDVDFCALDFCDVDFCDVDFCVLAIALFLRGEWTRPGREWFESLSNGIEPPVGHRRPVAKQVIAW